MPALKPVTDSLYDYGAIGTVAAWFAEGQLDVVPAGQQGWLFLAAAALIIIAKAHSNRTDAAAPCTCKRGQ